MKRLQTNYLIITAKTRGGYCDTKCRGCLTYHDQPYDGKPKWACTVFGKLLNSDRDRPQECVDADISAITNKSVDVSGVQLKAAANVEVEVDK